MSIIERFHCVTKINIVLFPYLNLQLHMFACTIQHCLTKTVYIRTDYNSDFIHISVCTSEMKIRGLAASIFVTTAVKRSSKYVSVDVPDHLTWTGGTYIVTRPSLHQCLFLTSGVRRRAD